MHQKNNRIAYLDGFRGLAILLVVFFHAFTKWSEIVPYGDTFAAFPVFNMGWLGVNLFFLISGFVILMTLEKCSGFKEFILKRWLRLFPAMLVATILIFSTSFFFPERPRGIPNLRDCIPGLVFIEQTWIGKFFHGRQDVLEGSFWSLFVEVKYCFIFGLLFFFVGKIKAIKLISSFFIVAFIGIILGQFIDSQILNVINKGIHEVSFIYLGWFAAGSFMYLYSSTKSIKMLVSAEIIGLMSVISTGLMYGNSIDIAVSAFIILQIFILVIYSDKLKKIFEVKMLIYFGFVSYPLYLLHENAMVAMIVKEGKYFPDIPGILLPLIPIAILMFISYLIANYIEPLINKFLKQLVLTNTK